MLIVTGSGNRLNVEVLDDVSFVRINAPMIGAMYAYWKLCDEYNVTGVVTGAAHDPAYVKEPLHQKGFAWDFRSFIFQNREMAYLRFQIILHEIDPGYRAVYIRAPKPEHFHVEWKAR